jgi:hypothetical protein
MSDPLKPLFSGLSPALDRLAQKAAAAGSLTDRVRAGLADEFRPHVISASRREADLVVIVDSAAWSARVRYAARQIKERLEAEGEPPVEKVRVKVRGGAARRP